MFLFSLWHKNKENDTKNYLFPLHTYIHTYIHILVYTVIKKNHMEPSFIISHNFIKKLHVGKYFSNIQSSRVVATVVFIFSTPLNGKVKTKPRPVLNCSLYNFIGFIFNMIMRCYQHQKKENKMFLFQWVVEACVILLAVIVQIFMILP